MKVNLDIAIIPEELTHKKLEGKTAVAIDVLRATTTIITALQNGSLLILPVLTPEEAFQKFQESDSPWIIGGERSGRKVAGFHLGNSPREYNSETVRGKKILLTTTNGTRVLKMVEMAGEVLICAFINLTAVAGRLAAQIQKGALQPGEVLIACAGTEGNFSLEDLVCAGGLVHKLDRLVSEKLKKSEAAEAAEILYRSYQTDLLGLFRRTRGGQGLIDIGLGEDLKFCSQIDLYDLVPQFKNGIITP
ncbi:MAG TPA: 2-phosphosulfolactate phosphatase [Candidatus Limnocylindrales bacterium]|nr:2-phosphosulfolactate phosphatase [Candidatus Limnocylindrales bacterium]